MNYSRQREIILNILKASRAHPTADEMWQEVLKVDASVARGTVFRNLSQLSKNGDIIRFVTPSGVCRFDYPHFSHSHAVCIDCGAVIDLPVDTATLEREIKEGFSFEPSGGAIIVGKCERCNKK